MIHSPGLSEDSSSSVLDQLQVTLTSERIMTIVKIKDTRTDEFYLSHPFPDLCWLLK